MGGKTVTLNSSGISTRSLTDRLVRVIMTMPLMIWFGVVQCHGSLEAQCTGTPDMIFVNAHIITMDPAQPVAEALAILDGQVQAVGDEEDIVALMEEGCPVQWVNADHHTILPGFNDAHCHWLSWREHLCDAPGQASITYPELAEVMDTLSRHGWTSISELNFGRPDIVTDHLDNAMALDAAGDLHVRVNGYWGTYDAPDLIDVLAGFGYGPGHVFSPRIRTPGVKMYVDDPFGTTDIMDQSTCTALVAKASQAGYQVAAHCVNQSAVGKILTAYESALGVNDNSVLRHRIEHAVKVSDDQLARMEQKGIVASFQLQGPPDWPEQNTFQTYISNTNTDFILRWRDFVESQIPVVGSTDAPFNNTVCNYSPFRAIYQAVTRMGYLDRAHASWELNQRITIAQGLKLLTSDGAWVTGEESVKGRLQPGMYADLTLVSADPLSVTAPEELLGIVSLLTMVGGQVEYCAADFPAACQPVTAFRVDTVIVTVSNYLDDQRPGNAFDMDEQTNWSAGRHPPQFIQIDLLRNSALDRVELVVGQFPNGFTLHRVSGGVDGDGEALEDLHTFGGLTMDNQVLSFDFAPANKTFRYLRISTIQSPSWVAWKEIRLFREGASGTETAALSPAFFHVYPNPAGREVTIEFELPVPQKNVEVRILSMDGSEGVQIFSGPLGMGKHHMQIPAAQMDLSTGSSGLVLLKSEDYLSIRKIIRSSGIN